MLKKLKNVGLFLVAQVFINDALSSAGGTINLVAISEVGITPWQQLISTTIFTVVSILSNYTVTDIVARKWISAYQGMIICLIIYVSAVIEQYFFLYNEF